MRLKDLPKDMNLVGVKIAIPKKTQLQQGLNKEMYIYSGWCKGLWLKEVMTEDRVYPLGFVSWKEIKNYRVIRGKKKAGEK